MSEAEGGRFEDTLNALEAERERIEVRFRELLEALSGGVGAVRSAAEQLEGNDSAQRDARAAALAALESATPGDAAARSAAWPSGGGLLRRIVNGFARWLLRDYLETVDRRCAAINAEIDGLQSAVAQLHVLSGSLADPQRGEQLAALLTASNQALEATAAVHEHMLELVNAKDAEVLQRAAHGPLRRMELIFDEFGRQQEALLAQLARGLRRPGED